MMMMMIVWQKDDILNGEVMTTTSYENSVYDK